MADNLSKLRKWRILGKVDKEFLLSIRLFHLDKSGYTGILVTFDEEVYFIVYNVWRGFDCGSVFPSNKIIPRKINYFTDRFISGIYSCFDFFIVRNDIGNLIAWDLDTLRQSVIDTTSLVAVPANIASLKNKGITQVSCGYKHVLALGKNGIIFSWGDNRRGQLGDGTINNSSIPIKVPFKGIEISNVNCGAESSYAVTKNGEVYCWGGNASRKFGTETEETAILNPTKVSHLSQYYITKIEVGHSNVLALSATGQLIIWGNHDFIANIVPNIIATDISDMAATWNSGLNVCQTDSKMYVWGKTRNGYFRSLTETSETNFDCVFSSESTNTLFEQSTDPQVMWKTLTLFKNWFEDYTLKEFLGSGSYGSVYRGVHNKHNSSFAIKMTYLEGILLTRNTTPSSVSDELKWKYWKSMEREYDVLKGKNHPCIVNVYECMTLNLTEKEVDRTFSTVENTSNSRARFINNNLRFWVSEIPNGVNVFIIRMELCDKTLRQWIDTVGETSTPQVFKKQSKIIQDLTDGIRFVHSHAIIHRDLKSENILLNISGEGNILQAKIGDFGVGRLLDDETKSKTTNPMTTLLYKAPELGCFNKNYTHQADLYSLGLIFLEVVLMIKSENRNDTFPRAIDNIDNVEVNDIFRLHFDKFKPLISKMIEKECSKRFPDITAVMQELNTILEF